MSSHRSLCENNNINEIFSSVYPKTRPILPKQYQKIYLEQYVTNREGLSLGTKITKWLETWGHRQAIIEPAEFPVLEIGAGTLNHLPYEKNIRDYDVVEPFTDLFKDRTHLLSKIRTVYADISQVPTESKYKRIISIWAFEHFENLPKVTAEATLRLSNDGELRIAIPTEGGLFWYCAWRFGTGLFFWLKYRLSYKHMMKHEHLNSADEIINVVKYFFDDVKIVRFPFNFKHLSFYSFIRARKPKVHLARDYLNSKF